MEFKLEFLVIYLFNLILLLVLFLFSELLIAKLRPKKRADQTGSLLDNESETYE